MISLRKVSKTYGAGKRRFHALRSVDLDIEKGEIFGIIGKSGAGKSTLIRCVNHLEKPTSGQVTVNRMDLTHLSSKELRIARRQMGMIFQHFNLLTRRNIYDNIALPLELAGFSKRAIREKVLPLIDITGLGDHVHKYPSQSSGGQKQRVAIARALAPAPKVLLSDEATSALDPSATQAIFDLLLSIKKEMGITILLITHEMEVVKAICDRVAIIENGSLIEQGTVFDLFTHPKTETAKAFVKMAARMEPPRALKDKMLDKPTKNSSTLLRIAYQGETAQQPLIGFLIQKYHMTVNIIQGNIEIIQGETIGIMIIEISGTPENMAQSLTFLQRNELNVEILGYVDIKSHH